MERHKYVYYEEDGFFIAHEELVENLKEIYHDLNSGDIPHVYHVGELELA